MSDFLIEVHRDLEELRLYSYDDQREQFVREKTYSVATGMPEHPTPRGRFRVTHRQRCPKWVVPSNIDWMPKEQWGNVYDCNDPQNPIKGRWIAFCRDVGIHGTDAVDSIGHPASHGCVRMRVADVEEIFPFAVKGTPVIVR